jgi:hypothetical protein
MTMCKNCGKAIKWFRDPVNDRWIPLQADCNLVYESPEEVDVDEVLQWKHKSTAVITCNKGCSTQIYFDPNPMTTPPVKASISLSSNLNFNYLPSHLPILLLLIPSFFLPPK